MDYKTKHMVTCEQGGGVQADKRRITHAMLFISPDLMGTQTWTELKAQNTWQDFCTILPGM